jgi:hypothetical protein
MNRMWLVGLCLVAAGLQAADLTEQEKAIVGELKTLRKVPDEQRGAVTRRIALEIRNLAPDASKVGLVCRLRVILGMARFRRLEPLWRKRLGNSLRNRLNRIWSLHN